LELQEIQHSQCLRFICEKNDTENNKAIKRRQRFFGARPFYAIACNYSAKTVKLCAQSHSVILPAVAIANAPAFENRQF